ncbi:MAG: bifunctional UDP-N-acetylglucosamine diphosphorylase/glucosamine-1-phosphate N-acetyltransferase GlmU [Actinomycetota bacterium]
MTPSAKGLSAIVLAAGRSTRFGGTSPKVLHPLCGRPILGHVLETLRAVHRSMRLREVCVVVPPGREVERAFAGVKFPFKLSFAVQKSAAGTGDAARVGLRKLGPAGEVLVCSGDVPLVRAGTLVELVRSRREAGSAAGILTAVLDDPGQLGRVLRTEGRITGVVEVWDAMPEQLELREINTCTYAFARDAFARVLPRLRADNAKKERYLTDVVGELVADGEHLAGVQGDPEEVLGTNTRAEFAAVAKIARDRIVGDLMATGVTVIDPDTTYVDADVRCGPDTVVLPNTYLEGSTSIGSGCEIGPNVRLVDTTVGDGAVVTFAVARESKIGPAASVGPFASLRPGTVLAKGAKVGTFAEMKNARIGEGSKVPHFSYLGDVTVGRDSNIGAGTITCNYDGRDKHPTAIGDEVFIGSDSILVAPVRVGSGAYTGAGSVVTRDVRPGELVYGVPATGRKRSKKATKKAGKAKKPRKKAAKRPTRRRKG